MVDNYDSMDDSTGPNAQLYLEKTQWRKPNAQWRNICVKIKHQGQDKIEPNTNILSYKKMNSKNTRRKYPCKEKVLGEIKLKINLH